jgi:hypothetical protein
LFQEMKKDSNFQRDMKAKKAMETKDSTPNKSPPLKTVEDKMRERSRELR